MNKDDLVYTFHYEKELRHQKGMEGDSNREESFILMVFCQLDPATSKVQASGYLQRLKRSRIV